MPWWGWLITVVTGILLILWTTAGVLAYRNSRKIARGIDEMSGLHDLRSDLRRR
jgi:hypothetical protein